MLNFFLSPKNKLPQHLQNKISYRLVHFVLPIIFIILISDTLFLIFFLPNEPKRFIPIIIAFVFIFPIWIWARRGHHLRATNVMLCLFCIAILSGMISNGGLHAPVYIGTVAMVGVFSVLYGIRNGFFFFIVSILIGSFFLWLENSGNLIPFNPASSSYILFNNGIWVLIALVFISIPVDFILTALKEIKEQHTALLSSQKAERESAFAFQAIFDRTVQNMVLLDPLGHIITANNAALKFAGVTLESVKGKLIYQGKWWNKEAMTRLESAIMTASTGESVNFHTQYPDNSHQTKSIEVSVTPFYDDKKTILYLILEGRDVTEMIDAQNRLNHTHKMDALGQLAGGVAHDFRNMLGAIIGSTEVLALKSQDESAKQLLSIIMNAATNATDLTTKLLTYARKQDLVLKPLDVHTSIKDTIQLLHRSIDKRIIVQYHLNATNYITLCDQTELQNALVNLGINARDAMPEGGLLTFSTQNITLDEKQCLKSSFKLNPGPYIAIEVNDMGSGIEKHIMKNIFDPFFTTKEIGKGTGLGLSSVYGMVKSANGSIDVISHVNKGTTFTISLPVINTNLQTQSDKPIIKGTGHILVIDDEKSMQMMTQAALEECGYTVTTADDGEEALSIFQDIYHNIDLVLIDMTMPKMNGRDCYQKMKDISPNLKAILASGFIQDSDYKDLEQVGFCDIIRKPYSLQDISMSLHQALNKEE